jgi:uncharacterized caspase-like protein
MLPRALRTPCAAAALFFWALAAPAAPAATESRLALVIGNDAYNDSPLLNPVNDAKAVSAALRSAGFEVIERHNQGAVEMRRAIREFGERLRGKGVGLFYFAGHGVQVNGRNFLVPARADIKYEDEIEDQSVDVALVLNKLESAKARVSLVILDACRNNPFVRGSRSAQQGLAAMEAPIGSLIAYATSPGQVASDGTGRNGLYTEYLVREMQRPGLKVEDVFKRVRAAVRLASNGRQVPWENTSLEGDFYFRPGSAEAAISAQESRRQQEAEIQRAVADALLRSKEEADRERKRLEAAFVERLEAEREAIRREAMERIAAAEKAALAAGARPGPAAPPPAEPAARSEEPDPILVALSGSVLDSRPRTVPEPAARALVASPPQAGDRWVFHREIRDGEAVTRRNYLTWTVASVDAGGYEVEASDSSTPWRFDASGNVLAAVAPGQRNPVAYDPLDPVFRFPLETGSKWKLQSRERRSGVEVRVESTVTVIGWEAVKVPAGAFQALKVSKVATAQWEPFPGQIENSKRLVNYWYVPSIHTFARFETLEVTTGGLVLVDQAWELDSFKLN